MLTQEMLKSLLHYNHVTGIFTWINPQSNRVQKGSEAKSVHPRHGYIRIGINGRRYHAQTLAWLYMTGEYPDEDIDHENCVRTDNRWVNLRKGSRSQNNWNQNLSSRNTSGVKGVTWHVGAKKWLARVNCRGKTHSCGLHTSLESARLAVEMKRSELRGAFANNG